MAVKYVPEGPDAPAPLTETDPNFVVYLKMWGGRWMKQNLGMQAYFLNGVLQAKARTDVRPVKQHERTVQEVEAQIGRSRHRHWWILVEEDRPLPEHFHPLRVVRGQNAKK